MNQELGMSDTNQDGSFADFVASERARLTDYREHCVAARGIADLEIARIDSEFAAIDAYEAAKAGKSNGGKIIAGLREAVGHAKRAPRGSRRAELLDIIRGSNGLKRGEILDRMGLKGDKAGEMSVSNALTALTRTDALCREGGRYYVRAEQPEWPTQEQSVALAEAAE